MIRVAVVDDEALVRRGLTVLLRLEPGLDVVGEAEDGAAAIALVRREHPDVVLMDIRMPGTDGLAATRALMADPETAATRVIILTTFDLDEYVFGAIRAGASGFLPKDTTPEELLTAIRVVADGDSLLAPKATRRLIEEFVRQSPVPQPTRPPGLDLLTDREIEVLRSRGSRALQHRDRRRARHQLRHGEVACQQPAGQAPGPRPGATGHAGL